MNTTIDKVSIVRDKIEQIKAEYPLERIVKHVLKNGLLAKGKKSNTKISKSNLSNEYRTTYLALLPANLSGFNVCPFHKHCLQDCIGVFSGQNHMIDKIESKLIKTLLFQYDSELFIQILMKDLERFQKSCRKEKKLPAVRLNTYSDVLWERKFPIIFSEFPSIQFYDYSKVYSRRYSKLPANYDLTYSGIASFHDNPDKLYDLAENSRISVVVSREVYDTYISHLGEGSYIDNNQVRYYNGEIDDMTFRYPEKQSVLVLREKSAYKITGQNPLVYRDARIIGL